MSQDAARAESSPAPAGPAPVPAAPASHGVALRVDFATGRILGPVEAADGPTDERTRA